VQACATTQQKKASYPVNTTIQRKDGSVSTFAQKASTPASVSIFDKPCKIFRSFAQIDAEMARAENVTAGSDNQDMKELASDAVEQRRLSKDPNMWQHDTQTTAVAPSPRASSSSIVDMSQNMRTSAQPSATNATPTNNQSEEKIEEAFFDAVEQRSLPKIN